jgi:hypothetical protein
LSIYAYLQFFNYLVKREWEKALGWLNNQGNNSIYESELKAFFDFILQQQTQLFNPDTRYSSSRFADIAKSSDLIRNNFTAWIKIQQSARKNYIYFAANWKVIVDTLSSISETTKALSLSKPVDWKFNKNGEEKAFHYINKLMGLEQALTGDIKKSNQWLGVAKSIIMDGKSPEKSALDKAHPLYEWLFAYYRDKVRHEEIINRILKGVWFVPVIGIILLGIWGFNGIVGFLTQPGYVLVPTNEIIPTQKHGEHQNPTAIILMTAIPTFTPTPELKTLTDVCVRFMDYRNTKKWDIYEQELESLGEVKYEELKGVCGFNYSYKQKLMDIGLNKLKQQIDQQEFSRQRMRQVQNDLVAIFQKNDIPDTSLFDAGRNGLSDYIVWLQSSLALCTSNLGVPVMNNVPERNNDSKIVRLLIESYSEKYDRGIDTMNALCTLNSNAIQEKNINLDNVNRVNLLQDWPPYRSDITPCLYYSENPIVYQFSHQADGNQFCQLSPVLPTTISQFSYLETHLCVFEEPQRTSYAYGIYIGPNNLLILDENTPVFTDSLIKNTNPGCFSPRQYVDIRVFRTGNLLIWQSQLTDEREDPPVFVPKDKPVISIQVLPDELNNQPIQIGFWAQSVEELRIIVYEMFMYKSGGG